MFTLAFNNRIPYIISGHLLKVALRIQINRNVALNVYHLEEEELNIWSEPRIVQKAKISRIFWDDNDSYEF